jgi:hypothetical protein
VRAVGSAAPYEAWRSTPTFAVAPPPLSLAANVDFPTPPGNQVTWTATSGSPGSVPLEYRFRVRLESSSTWTIFRDYATSNKAHWTPQAAGRYVVEGLARQVGTTTVVSATSSPFDVGASSLTVKALTANRTSPTPTGTAITWTARVQGGTSGPLQYQFWLYSSLTGWRNAQPYGPSETFTWTPTWGDEANYTLQVWVRSNGSTAAYEHWRSATALQVQPASIHLTTPTLFPAAPGNPVNWAANVPDPAANMEYQFWVYSSATAQWSLAQAYGPLKTFNWVPGPSGTYGVEVRARQVGSSAPFELSRASDALQISQGPAFVQSLTSSLALPVKAGTTVTWTAAASGGAAALEYQFWRQDGSTWILAQDYSPLNSYTWFTTAASVGSHQVQVRVRSIGSSAAFDSQITTGTFSIQP